MPIKTARGGHGLRDAATGCLCIALPLYVLGVSGSALDTSTVFLAELIPAVVIGTVCAPLTIASTPGGCLLR